MSLLQAFGRLYSVDTLDTRFGTSSKSPPSQIDPTKPSPRDGQNLSGKSYNGASPPKWKTPEFSVYGLVFLVAIPWMFYTVYDVSQPWNPNYTKFDPLLSPGWIPGRKVDNSDAQYAGFRGNVPYLLILMAVHPLVRRVFDTLYLSSRETRYDAHRSTASGAGSPAGRNGFRAEERLDGRMTFDVGFNLLYIFALHGSSAPKILFILYLNYMIATKLKSEYVPVGTWVFNIAILFANELAQGYSYGRIVDRMFSFAQADGKSSDNWGSYLDSYGGLQPRWDIHFNVTVLRLISFNLDYLWAKNRSGSNSPVEKKQVDASNLSERDRVNLPVRSSDYSVRNYIAYALYAPLYLAGPILTFNDFVSQQRYTPPSITYRRTLMYGIRFLIALLIMELMIHFIYVVAISKAEPAWEIYTPAQLSMLGFFNLHHIWLKLLLPWRFFRLWALVDKIDPPENMVRCMSDNYSALAFWRGWHRSFNRWIIRYIYIPLGGSGGQQTQGKGGTFRAVLNVFVVFSFVAMWHDIQLRLLVWGWLITLFILPEIVAGFVFPKSKWQKHKETYRVICGVGAVGNILMMMSANLVGFAVGLDGLRGLVQGIIGSYSALAFLAAACAALFTGAQVMFELRQQEIRQGINMRC